ncbi:MAG: glycosyltransferase family 4 protein [Candidatus Eisenbacteria bacterium]
MSETGVIHIRASNFFGGPEKQITRHAELLREAGIATILCSFHEKRAENELVRRARAGGVTCVSIPCSNSYDPRQILELRRLFLRERPGVVCTHDYRSTVLSLAARAGLRLRHVVFRRGTTAENLKVRLFHRLERLLLGRVDHVVVVSAAQKASFVSSGLPEAKISMIWNAVDVSAAEGGRQDGRDSVQGGARGPGVVIATAGRLSPEKGHIFLIEAMPQVRTIVPQAELHIYGDGPLGRKLREHCRMAGCSGYVRFMGFVPDFAARVRDACVFVLPSLSEGLPNVLLEALASARPVVATRVGGVPDVVVDGATGLLVAPGRSRELAGAILKLLTAPELANRLGEAGRDKVRSEFSFERQFELLTNLYSKT